MEIAESTDGDVRRTSPWPYYDAAVTGLRNYWYPVAWATDVRSKPVPLQLAGERIVLIRDGERIYGLADQCPHRGIPLSVGRREFPGSWSCRYHGWTFDLESGVLRAALTDGPDSPICGKVRVKTYPVEERAGLVWVYVGDGPPPQVEADIPREFLEPDAVVAGRITIQRGNWRCACENGADTGHPWFLHRYGALWTLFDYLPAWTRNRIEIDGDGWISYPVTEAGPGGDFPGLGHWPPPRPQGKRTYKVRVAMGLPGVLKMARFGKPYVHFIWWTPIDRDHYRQLQFYVQRAAGVEALIFRVLYHLYWKPLHHVQFNGQDAWVVGLMPDTAPQRLYRPDATVTAWRKLCEQARGSPRTG